MSLELGGSVVKLKNGKDEEVVKYLNSKQDEIDALSYWKDIGKNNFPKLAKFF